MKHIHTDRNCKVHIRACETLIDVGLKSILHARKDQPAFVTSRWRRKYMYSEF